MNQLEGLYKVSCLICWCELQSLNIWCALVSLVLFYPQVISLYLPKPLINWSLRSNDFLSPTVLFCPPTNGSTNAKAIYLSYPSLPFNYAMLLLPFSYTLFSSAPSFPGSSSYASALKSSANSSSPSVFPSLFTWLLMFHSLHHPM